MEHITSRQNALMTHIRKLNASRAYRRASAEYLCDGVKLLEALRWNAPLKTVVLSEGVDAPTLPSGVRAVQVPADVMRSISPMETPQGRALYRAPAGHRTARNPERRALPCARRRAGPRQRGAPSCARRTPLTATACFSSTPAPTPTAPKRRAPRWARSFAAMYQCTADEALRAASKSSLPLYGTALRDDTVSLRDAELSRAAVAIGSEGRGLSAEILSKCEKKPSRSPCRGAANRSTRRLPRAWCCGKCTDREEGGGHGGTQILGLAERMPGADESLPRAAARPLRLARGCLLRRRGGVCAGRGLSKKQIELLADKSADGADKILGDCQRLGLRILTMQDADYPARLRGIFETALPSVRQGHAAGVR